MSLAIQHCALINEENFDNNNSFNLNNKKNLIQNRRNKTLKNNKSQHEKSREIMQNIARDGYNESLHMDDDTDDIMGNFTPLPKNCKTSGHVHIEKIKENREDIPELNQYKPPQGSYNLSNNNNIDNNINNNTNNSYIPNSYNNISENFQENVGSNYVSNAELLKKLDNILHILEEQSEEKTNYIMEELILYIFLGVFIIFVIDSFVRVGKYIR